MHIIFNFTVIVMVFLIAYWWSNQGLFSSLLHMVAVIVAGAITLSVWEFLVWDLALGNTGVFDNYVTGLSFVFVFLGALLLMRVATDKLIEENLKVPPMVDLIGGFALGAVSGILAIGLLLIGTGFLQRPHEFMGYKGYGREKVGDSQIGTVGPKLWLPVDMLTSQLLRVGEHHRSATGHQRGTAEAIQPGTLQAGVPHARHGRGREGADLHATRSGRGQ